MKIGFQPAMVALAQRGKRACLDMEAAGYACVRQAKYPHRRGNEPPEYVRDNVEAGGFKYPLIGISLYQIEHIITPDID